MSAGVPRCVSHPATPAAGPCPRCGRPRCARDSAAGVDACGICHPRGRERSTRVPPAERLVRGCLAAVVSAPLAGAVCSQYVDTPGYAFLLPVLSAVGITEAVLRAGGRPPLVTARLARTLGAVAVLGAVLAVAAGFAFTPGDVGLTAPLARVAPPYALAATAAVTWTVLTTSRP